MSSFPVLSERSQLMGCSAEGEGDVASYYGGEFFNQC